MAMQARQSTSNATSAAAVVVEDEEEDHRATNVPINKLEVKMTFYSLTIVLIVNF